MDMQLPVGPALQSAIEFVQSEVAGICGNQQAERERFAALSASNYVQCLLSPARWGSVSPQPQTTEECLTLRTGICGGQVGAVIDILKALDITVREVQVYYLGKDGKRHSHIGVEVQWAGAWHFFDVTWGFHAVDESGGVLAFSELSERPYTTRINEGNPWYQHWIRHFDAFEYLTAPDRDIVIDGNGTVHPYLEDGILCFLHVPKYVGFTLIRSGNIGEIKTRVPPINGATGLRVFVKGKRLVAGDLRIATGSEAILLPVRDLPPEFTIPMNGRVDLSVVNNDGNPCYVVFDRMEVIRQG